MKKRKQIYRPFSNNPQPCVHDAYSDMRYLLNVLSNQLKREKSLLVKFEKNLALIDVCYPATFHSFVETLKLSVSNNLNPFHLLYALSVSYHILFQFLSRQLSRFRLFLVYA